MSTAYKIRTVRKECENYKHARLQISVGQLYHEGGKFYSTALWAAENFEKVSVNLCDFLQRHNLVYLGYSPFQAFDKAISLGDEWLERNKAALALLPNLEITRWEDWKRQADWHHALITTRRLYDEDIEFQSIMEKSIEDFWQRRKLKSNLPEAERSSFAEASSLYLLEEVTATLVMSRPDIAEIYPGTFPTPVYYLREKGMNAPTSMTTIAFSTKKEKVAA